MANVAAIAAEIDRRLRAAGTPERAANEKRYLKSTLEFYGVTVPVLHKVVKAAWRDHPDLGRGEVRALAETLWDAPRSGVVGRAGDPADIAMRREPKSRGQAPRSGAVHERRAAAVEVLSRYCDVLGADDIGLVERLLREAKTWALVDHLAAFVAGGLVARFGLGDVLDRWAADEDFWIRRSALLALLIPLRGGAGDFARFARYADSMLEEKEFFVRKAIGWVLRDTARKRPEMVYEWIAPRTHRASGVTMREVVKPMSDEQRQALMAAYRARRPAA